MSGYETIAEIRARKLAAGLHEISVADLRVGMLFDTASQIVEVLDIRPHVALGSRAKGYQPKVVDGWITIIHTRPESWDGLPWQLSLGMWLKDKVWVP